MVTALLALAAGLLSLRFMPQLPPPWVWGILLVVSGIVLRTRLWPLAFLSLGFGWACLQGHWALQDRLPLELDGRTFWLEGQVQGLPSVQGNVVRFELVDISSRHAGLPSQIRLAWYGGPQVRAGERWRVAAKLKRPRGLVSPHTFDYEAWLLSHRVGASGTVKAGELRSPAPAGSGWRDRLRGRLLDVSAQGRSGAVAALVVGDDSGLSPADWQVLQATGTVHLMVISGQHVGMLAGLLYGLVALAARWGLWPSRLPWLPWACTLAGGGALAYGWLAGFEVPVQRACMMVVLVLVWRLRFRHLGVWLPVLVALDVVLIYDPLVALQSGFWLSFLAVAMLAFVFRGRLGVLRWWRTLGRAQWSMSLGLLPVLLALGLPISLTAPLANLIAVPLVSAVIVPLSLLGTLLLGVPLLGETVLWIAGGLISMLFGCLDVLAAWQPAWLAPSMPLWAWVMVWLGTLVILLPAGIPGRALGWLLLAPLLFPPIDRPEPGQAEVWVMDVGQGLSVLVRTAEHAMLYDAGPRYGDFDIGERVVHPALRGLGIAGLDLLLLSHADSDHAGGALAIQRGLEPLRVVSGEPDRLPAALGPEPCRSGQRWEWDGVRFALWRWNEAKDGNGASCVLLVDAGGERLLLTGDIDVAAEQALLESAMPIRARWLLLPHHGSRSSSSEAFIEAVGARDALVSRSLHNAFGHPHPEVVERLRQAGIGIHDTAISGALRLRLGRFEPVSALRDEQRFWREK
ncbi:DNA internalization-related competence protein ComEC/Rec2 [Pseudomonas sp. PS1]|uniref:DNA internalization-related competence protein ComEC/Rec2 n=1 Tax=Stutzerimonas marianensis TaxID=2929513 RepID=A0A9X2AVL7_9GAMM|nr:DNA internalization-related competence protein ComEC/Rec2 [Pseudomonas marianensis]MCJ0974331.1 DNA internalization-related competence protein ComEC/Rec2 [Pseudomonas marianensis]